MGRYMQLDWPPLDYLWEEDDNCEDCTFDCDIHGYCINEVE